MTHQSTPDLNAGVLAPVADEVDVFDLPVEGRIPDELHGQLIRNGPNPYDGAFTGATMLDWWVAPSMLHAIAIDGGRARWYRNRWVHNDAWATHHRRSPLPGIGVNTNVNVIANGDRILALGEGAPPVEIDRELNTIGAVTFDGALPNGMTAHPKLDPATGDLRFFRADWQEPYLQLGSVSRGQTVNHLRDVPLDRPVMMHDFATTERFDLVLDLNVVYDFSLLEHGVPIPLRWDDEHRTRIGAVAKDGANTIWFDIQPCFVQHVVNAYENGDLLVLDAVRYPHFLRFDDARSTHTPNPLGVLWRFELDLKTGSVVETQLDDRAVELPRIDDRRIGIEHRQLYAVEQPTDAEMRGVRSYDLRTGEQDRFDVPPGDQNSEPVFVPSSIAGDRGWLLVCVYRAERDATDVVVLDAFDLSAPPEATIRLPRRIPAGFHGAWISGDHPSLGRQNQAR